VLIKGLFGSNNRLWKSNILVENGANYQMHCAEEGAWKMSFGQKH